MKEKLQRIILIHKLMDVGGYLSRAAYGGKGSLPLIAVGIVQYFNRAFAGDIDQLRLV